MIVRRILLINIILLFVIAVVSYNFYSEWQEYQDSRPLERIVARVAEQPGGRVLPDDYSGLADDGLQRDFYTIGANDLFHPDRRPPEVDSEAGTGRAEAPQFPKDPEMQGVIESQGERKALITVFDNRNSTTGESRIVGVNDSVQGWTVAEITDTTTRLTWNELSETIDIFGSGSSGQSSSRPSPGSKSAINIVKIGSRQSVVETTSVDTPAAGEGGMRDLRSSPQTRGGSTVGTGRVPSRPSTLPGRRPESSPD